MVQLPENPFLKNSKELSAHEIEASTKRLEAEVKVSHERAAKIRKKAAMARARREAIRKAEREKSAAQVAASREKLEETVASITDATEKHSLRPKPPSPETYAPGSAVGGNSKFSISGLLDDYVSIPMLLVDTVISTVAITCAVLIFMKI